MLKIRGISNAENLLTGVNRFGHCLTMLGLVRPEKFPVRITRFWYGLFSAINGLISFSCSPCDFLSRRLGRTRANPSESGTCLQNATSSNMDRNLHPVKRFVKSHFQEAINIPQLPRFFLIAHHMMSIMKSLKDSGGAP